MASMKRTVRGIAAIVAVTAVGGICSTASAESPGSSGFPATSGSYGSAYVGPEEKRASQQANELRTSATQAVSVISQHVSRLFRGPGGIKSVASMIGEPLTGLSAGGGSAQTGVWANYDYTRAVDSSGDAGVATKMNNFILGGDRKVANDVAVGVSVSYQTTNGTGLDSDSHASTLAPYAAYQINENMSLDAVVGYTQVSTKRPQLDREKYDTKRYFLSSNVSAYTTSMDKLDVTAHAGFLFVKDSVDAYTGVPKNDISFFQVKTGIETAYTVAKGIQPYFNMDYDQDLVYEANPIIYGDTGAVLGVGTRFELPASLLGDVHYGRTVGRKNFEQDAFMVNVRASF